MQCYCYRGATRWHVTSLLSDRQWFLRPTQDLAVLCRRQEVIRFFTSPQNSDVLSTLQSLLRNIRNIPVTNSVWDIIRILIKCHPVWSSVRTCLLVCGLESPAPHVFGQHQGDRLAESLQGWNYREALPNVPLYMLASICVCVFRLCTVWCVSETRCDICLNPLGCFVTSAEGFLMISATSPPSLAESYVLSKCYKHLCRTLPYLLKSLHVDWLGLLWNFWCYRWILKPPYRRTASQSNPMWILR